MGRFLLWDLNTELPRYVINPMHVMYEYFSVLFRMFWVLAMVKTLGLGIYLELPIATMEGLWMVTILIKLGRTL